MIQYNIKNNKIVDWINQNGYKVFMSYKKILPKIKPSLPIDNSIVSSLYTLSIKSQLTALVFVVLVAIFLYSELSYSIVIWGGLLFAFTLFRLYSIYLFKTAYQRYSVETWYKFFMITALSTAVMYLYLVLYISTI